MFENRPFIELTLGRSSVRQRILALLMSAADGRLHLREIQRRANTSPGTASRELARLVAAGLIVREAEGNQVYFRASTSPFATILRTLLVAMPEPEVGPRAPRLPRAKSSPASAAAAVTEPNPAAAVTEPSPAPGTGQAKPSAGSTESDVAGEAVVETARRDITVAAGEAAATALPAATEAAPRIIRPRPVDQASTALPTETDVQSVPTAPAGMAPGVELGPTAVPPSTLPPRLTPRSARPTGARPTGAAPAATRPAAPDPEGMQIAGRLAESVRSMYRDAVQGIYLYGPRAAGPAPDSDVETIIVLDHVDQYGAELERTSHLYAALSYELNLVVSRIFVTEADWSGGSDGTLPQMRAKAVAV